jgi:UDP-N-acetylglucosamine 2-epimerase (non-hydrolysing)
VAALCCAPTERAADALAAEGIAADRIHVTGNTVIDALLATVRRERDRAAHWQRKHAALGDAPVVLVTAHRRESFGRGLEAICRAIRVLADRFADHRFVYPVHLNPSVREPVGRLLRGAENVDLVDPPAYPEFVWLMDRARLVLTDSGGVQEEAPSLGKPVVVMRERTDRPELVEAGASLVVGTSVERIVAAAEALLTDPARYAACQIAESPYGDGRAAERIVELMLRFCAR